MEKKNKNKKEMFAEFLGQESSLPQRLKSRQEFIGEKIRFFAYVDLNRKFELSEQWLVLTASQLVFCEKGIKDYNCLAINLSELTELKENSGLSANRLTFFTKGGAILTVRYSHRQSRVVSLIKFIVEQDIAGKTQNLILEKDTAEEAYQNQILQTIKEAQASVAGNKMAVVWRLMSYLKNYKKQVITGFFGSAMMTLLALVPAWITGYIIDNVIKPFQQGAMTMVEAKELSLVAILALAVMYGLREFFAWIRLKTMSIMGEQVAKDIRDEVYEHLHKLSIRFFSSKQTGSIISRVGSDTDRIWDFVAFGIVEVISSVLLLLGLSVVLIYKDWKLGLLVTLPVPLYLWAIVKHGDHMKNMFLRAWRKWSELTDCLSDTIPGIRVVKAFCTQDQEVEKFKNRNNTVFNEFVNIHESWTVFWPILMLTIKALFVAVWFFGVPRVLEHVADVSVSTQMDRGLTIGTFVTFLLYLTMFVQPIEIIGQMARMANRAISSAHRVFEVIDTEPQVINIRYPQKIDNLIGAIKFQNVGFSYDGVRKVIKDVTFEVAPGEMIGLVGPSGSGKSTLVNLLSRFYDIDSGSIQIDGKDLKNIEIESYRRQIGMVLQEPYLFHGTIFENIKYAKPEATYEEVIEAAKAANAHDFICSFSHAYDTVVGERGHTLSGGERQRVSIARAILRNPRLLILDEATSAVDTETEFKIQEALDRLISGRTVIAIAHRLSTLKRAHRILVMKSGELVEQGTHRELCKGENGTYKKLVEMQQTMAL